MRITLVNDITPAEDVTLHFHGVVMGDGYVSMDGPESVTQWYVSPFSECPASQQPDGF